MKPILPAAGKENSDSDVTSYIQFGDLPRQQRWKAATIAWLAGQSRNLKPDAKLVRIKPVIDQYTKGDLDLHDSLNRNDDPV